MCQFSQDTVPKLTLSAGSGFAAEVSSQESGSSCEGLGGWDFLHWWVPALTSHGSEGPGA